MLADGPAGRERPHRGGQFLGLVTIERAGPFELLEEHRLVSGASLVGEPGDDAPCLGEGWVIEVLGAVYGPVDVGIQLRGLAGGVFEAERTLGTRPYESDLERQHRRRSAVDFIDRPVEVALDLLRGFLERLYGEGYQPPLRPGRH